MFGKPVAITFLLIGISSPIAASAADCFHGKSNHIVEVKICRDNPTGCLSFCISGDAWETDKARATLFRHVLAASDGGVSLRDLQRWLPDGLRPGTKETVANVTIRTEKLIHMWGRIY